MPEGIGYNLPGQGQQPQSPEQQKQNEEGWFKQLKEWQASPEMVGAMMQIGTALSQPQAYGQSAQGQITNAIAETGPFLDRLRSGQRKDREQDIRTRDVSRLEAGQRSTQASQEAASATAQDRLGIAQDLAPSQKAANEALANQRNRPPQPRAQTRAELLAGMTPAEKRENWVADQAALLMDPLSGVKDPKEIPARLAEIQQLAQSIYPDPPPTPEAAFGAYEDAELQRIIDNPAVAGQLVKEQRTTLAELNKYAKGRGLTKGTASTPKTITEKVTTPEAAELSGKAAPFSERRAAAKEWADTVDEGYLLSNFNSAAEFYKFVRNEGLVGGIGNSPLSDADRERVFDLVSRVFNTPRAKSSFFGEVGKALKGL